MKTIAVIGLGKFGFYIAKSLSRLDTRVIAVDNDEKKVQEISEFVDDAFVIDSTNKQALEEVGIYNLETVIVSIGENIEASILTVMALKDLNNKNIIAKAITSTHGEILSKIGAFKVIYPEKIEQFEAICRRERCLYAIVGEATKEQKLVVNDTVFDNNPVDMPLNVLLGKPPKMHRQVESRAIPQPGFEPAVLDMNDVVERLLKLPTIASKNFLITIGDRSITGMVTRDQMVGPWQVPVANAGITCSDYQGYTGEAMASGERPPVALINPKASARLSIAEAITNIACAKIGKMSDIKISANWMAAAGHQSVVIV
ncbi:MAG: NAD-binding protein, partial [Arcobacter sp.]|nr:NAD-binding protein [Arcobacter sp.]